MKAEYQALELEIIQFECEDVLTSSREYNMPDIPVY